MDEDVQPPQQFLGIDKEDMGEDAQPPWQQLLYTNINRGTTWMKMLNPSSKVQTASPALSQAAGYLGV